MTNHMRARITIIALLIYSIIFPSLLFARSNILTAGIGVSLDYDDRQYDSFIDDPDTEADERLTPRGEDDYRSLVITPLVVYSSSSPRDNFEIHLEPDLRYDLIDYDTDWDANATVMANRFINRAWQLGISNHFLRSDYYRSTDELAAPVTADTEPAPDSVEPPPQAENPELSPDIGRTRYWQNTLNLYSDYFYRGASLIRLGFNYRVLRYDDDPDIREEDYDRYELFLLNNHRFNPVWNTSLDLRFIQGDYEPTNRDAIDAIIEEISPGDEPIPISEDDLSNDLNEYRLLFTVNNESIAQNPLFAQYYYIGTRYDGSLRNDNDIQQIRLNWRRDFSPRFYTILGAGPSYEKTEGQNGNWDYNGLIEINYQTNERSSCRFSLEKIYDVYNFDGTRQRGVSDFWNARFSLDYSMTRNLSMAGYLSYIYEDRSAPIVAVDRVLASGEPLAGLDQDELIELATYHNDRYYAGVGLNYTFWQYYSASVNYTYTKRESDRINDDYDDHRILLTLSWQKDILRW